MRLLFLMPIMMAICLGSIAQTIPVTIQSNMNPKRVYVDSLFKVPVLNTNRTFATASTSGVIVDSIGQMWMRPDSIKLFGRFPGNTIKAIAIEDSVRALRWAVNNPNNLYIQNQTATNQTANYSITGSGRIGTYLDLAPQASNPAYTRGRLFYDGGNEAAAYMDDVSGTILQIGQEEIVRARNNTGATITNGSVVYISGAVGQTPTIALARANTLATSQTVGMATHDIANNTVGKVTILGLVNDLNTSSFTDGAPIYLSPTTAGLYTATKPAYPNRVVLLGHIAYSHINQGKILLRPNEDAHADDVVQNQTATAQSASYNINGTATVSGTPTYSTGGYSVLGINTTSSRFERVPVLDTLTAHRTAITQALGQTLNSVLTNGNAASNNILFNEVSGGYFMRWNGFSDYAQIRFTSTGDLNSTSNLVFTAGDNNDAGEGFIFQKDTANNGGASPSLDVLMTLNSNVNVSMKNFRSMGEVRSTNGTIVNLMSFDAANGFGYSGTFSNHPLTLFTNGNERVRITTGGSVGITTTNPLSGLQVNNSVAFQATTLTASTTLASYYYVNVNNSANITLTLPAASTCPGRTYVVKKISNNANTITLQPASGTIETAATYVMSVYLGSRTVYNDGSNWWVQ